VATTNDHISAVDLLLHVPDHVPLGHRRSPADHRVDHHVVDDLGVLERVFELADPASMPCSSGGVVTGVLLEVAFLAGTFDLVGDLDAAAGGAIVESTAAGRMPSGTTVASSWVGQAITIGSAHGGSRHAAIESAERRLVLGFPRRVRDRPRRIAAHDDTTSP
jgi:hypothetical protein